MLLEQALLHVISIEHLLLAPFFLTVSVLMFLEMRKNNGVTRGLFWIFTGTALGELWSIWVSSPLMSSPAMPRQWQWGRAIQLAIVLVGVVMFTIGFVRLKIASRSMNSDS